MREAVLIVIDSFFALLQWLGATLALGGERPLGKPSNVPTPIMLSGANINRLAIVLAEPDLPAWRLEDWAGQVSMLLEW